MKKCAAVLGVLVLAIAVTGCSKNDDMMGEPPENMTMDELGVIGSDQKAPGAQAAASAQGDPASAQEMPAVAQPVIPDPQAMPISAGVGSPQEIQAALKNAGFYSGKIDGKIGPMTKQAIIEFQKANKLKADGKVGPRTWEVLSRHLGESASSR